jgi:hypothetical protein
MSHLEDAHETYAVFKRRVLALDDADLAQTFFEGIHRRWWLPKALMEKAYNRQRLLT